MTQVDNWSQRGKKVLMNTFKRGDKVMVAGSGSYMTDNYGKKYLDFISGIAVNALGHANPAIVHSLTDQGSQLIHSSNLFWNTPSIELAEKLTTLSGLDKVFFSNSGAEANEGAIKLARKYGKETKGSDSIEIISMNQSFHGRTMATLTATGQAEMHKDYAPNVEGFSYVAFNDSEALKQAITRNTCAILIEVIQGEGGINSLTEEFVQTLNEIQADQSILIIIDEVQTGIARTGTYFAFQQFDLKPDIITLAKGLGGGFPIGAIIATDDAASHFNPGDHGTTFGGNPLATAVANTVLDEIEKADLIQNVQDRSEQLVVGLESIKEAHSAITAIKGKGLLVGVELDKEVDGSELIQACYDLGLLLISAKGNVIRFIPPLNVTESEIDEALAIFKEAVAGY